LDHGHHFGISFISDCGLGFTLYASVFFGLNGIWNWEEDLRLSLVSLVLFYLSGKLWAKGGELTRNLALRLTAPIGLASPDQLCLPPPVSPAPTSLTCPHRPRLPLSALLEHAGLACPHGEEDGSARVLAIVLQLWQSALGFRSLSFRYRSVLFPRCGSIDNSSTSLLPHHLLVSTLVCLLRKLSSGSGLTFAWTGRTIAKPAVNLVGQAH
jgi:hypothetical protein